MKKYSAYQFTLFRVLVGLGLLLYFLSLNPYIPELSHKAVYGIPLFMFNISNPLLLLSKELTVRYAIVICSIISIFVAIGFFRQIATLFLFFAMISVTNIIPILPTPLDGFMPYVLILCIVIPAGELHGLFRKAHWRIPPFIFLSSKYVLALSIIACSIFSFLANDIKSLPNIMYLFIVYAVISFFLLFKKIHVFAWILLFCLFIFQPITSSVHGYIFSIAALIFSLDPYAVFLDDKSENKVIYIDGECVLCNGFASFILEEDVQKNYKIASLQGEFAKTTLPYSLNKGLASVVYYDGQSFFSESAAVIRILGGLGGIWIFIFLLLLVPKILRDIIYRLIAKYRYKIFGKFDSCQLPSAEDRARVLN